MAAKLPIHQVAGALPEIAGQLRHYREDVLRLSEERMASRLGVSRSKYRRMEAADPGVAVGTWLRAWELMDVLGAVVAAAEPGEQAFEKVLSDYFPEYGDTEDGDIPGHDDDSDVMEIG